MIPRVMGTQTLERFNDIVIYFVKEQVLSRLDIILSLQSHLEELEATVFTYQAFLGQTSFPEEDVRGISQFVEMTKE